MVKENLRAKVLADGLRASGLPVDIIGSNPILASVAADKPLPKLKVEIPQLLYVKKIPTFQVSEPSRIMASDDFMKYARELAILKNGRRNPSHLPLAALAESAGEINHKLADPLHWETRPNNPNAANLVGTSNLVLAKLSGGVMNLAGDELVRSVNTFQEKSPRVRSVSLPGLPTIRAIFQPRFPPPEKQTNIQPVIQATPSDVKKRVENLLGSVVTGFGKTLEVGRLRFSEVFTKVDPILVTDRNDEIDCTFADANTGFEKSLAFVAWSLLRIAPTNTNTPAERIVLSGKHNRRYYQTGKGYGDLAGHVWFHHACEAGNRTVEEAVYLARVLYGNNIVKGVDNLVKR